VSRRLELPERILQLTVQGLELLVLLARRDADVAGIEVDPGEGEGRPLFHQLRERDRLLHRRHAHPMHPEVELDQHPHRAVCTAGRLRQRLHRLDRVERHHEVDLAGKPGEAVRLEAHGRVSDQQVARHPSHHFGFARRGAGEPDRAVPDLLRGHADGLVGLDVRPEPEVVRRGVLRHPIDVAIQPVEVDEGNRSFKFEGHFHIFAIR
jgi:hypothetical protein